MKAYHLSLAVYSVLVLCINISSSSHCHGPEYQQPCKCFIGKYQCLYVLKCDWQFSKCVESTTDFPTYQPTADPFAKPQPTPNPNTNTLTCGDILHSHWHHHDITFKLNLPSDTQSITINACNSNFDTTLQLYQYPQSHHPLYADDNACDNNYSSSLITVDNGLSAGTYYLLLSANTATPTHSTYELQILCTQNNDTAAADLCASNCDAFSVKLLYYGLLQEYNTSHIHYDNRRVLQSPRSDAGTSDIVCYTYEIQRLLADGMCADTVTAIVLGVCPTDYHKLNDIDLDALIYKQFSGDIYAGYDGVAVSEISGVEIDITVDEVAKEFTLCMHGVNDEGAVSHLVQFKRGNKPFYVCDDEGNDGLPCLSEIAHIEMDSVQTLESRISARILQAILVISVSVMVVIALLYLFVTVQKGKRLKAVASTDIDWAEINVSDTLSSSEAVSDKLSCQLSEESESTAEEDEADPLDEYSDDKIANLKENLTDLNNKFVNRKKRKNKSRCRSYRSSISSVRSENDGCTILPLYQEYDNDAPFFDDTMSENGYFLNAEAYIDDNSKSDA